MRMYSAKHFASLPLSICSPATSQSGALTPCSPASEMPCSIAVGAMSSEPTICSWLSSSWTS